MKPHEATAFDTSPLVGLFFIQKVILYGKRWDTSHSFRSHLMYAVSNLCPHLRITKEQDHKCACGFIIHSSRHGAENESTFFLFHNCSPASSFPLSVERKLGDNEQKMSKSGMHGNVEKRCESSAKMPFTHHTIGCEYHFAFPLYRLPWCRSLFRSVQDDSTNKIIRGYCGFLFFFLLFPRRS